MRSEAANPGRAPTGRAFTLVELLTVIVIMLLLFGILMPTISAVMRARQAMATQVRISALDAGARAYRQDTGYYPGQQYADQLAGTAGTYTGSQWLARALLTDMSFNFPTGAYTTYDPEMLFDPTGGLPNSIADCFATKRAILYFPSRLGLTDLTQFVLGDNSTYIGSAWSGSGWNSFIQDSRFGSGAPYNSGEFIIAAPGLDRSYGTSDDQKNF